MAGWPTPRQAPDGQAGGMTATTSTQGSGPVARHAGAALRRPTTATGPAIQATGLRKKFGRVMAVEDVSFTVSYGRITGFLGTGARSAALPPHGVSRRAAGRGCRALAERTES